MVSLDMLDELASVLRPGRDILDNLVGRIECELLG